MTAWLFLRREITLTPFFHSHTNPPSLKCRWSATQLTQYFEFTQVIPHNSYIHTFWDSWEYLYSANGEPVGVYFRDVDFSDPEIQSQMKSYIRELADSPHVGAYPERFWLEDMETYVNTFGLQSLSFEEQLDRFLSIPAVV